jgi:hypothetical protein
MSTDKMEYIFRLRCINGMTPQHKSMYLHVTTGLPVASTTFCGAVQDHEVVTAWISKVNFNDTTWTYQVHVSIMLAVQ